MKKLIVGNWKMNPPTYAEAEKLMFAVLNEARRLKKVAVVLCPPFMWLGDLSRNYAGEIDFGAQDVFWEEKGAYTGEISPRMLTSSKVKYVIVGHSERRALGETDEMVNKKLKAALKRGLKVILCVGEPWSVRRKGLAAAKRFVKNQLRKDLAGTSRLRRLKSKGLIIAYEPVWAIGTGRPDKPAAAVEMVKFIKHVVGATFLIPYSQVLYGGSVNAKNASEFLSQKGIDGALVGGASLKPSDFQKIIKSANHLQ